MGFNRPQETRIEVSGYTQSREPSTVLWRIEQALEVDNFDLREECGRDPYSDLRNYKVTLIIEEV